MDYKVLKMQDIVFSFIISVDFSRIINKFFIHFYYPNKTLLKTHITLKFIIVVIFSF